MHIQNFSHLAQASPSDKISNTGHTNYSKPIVVPAPSTDSAVQLGVSLALPLISTVQTTEQQASSDHLQSVADKINQAMQQSNRSLEFAVDTSTKKPIVKLIDSETGDLIRQFPSEEMLAISRSLEQFQNGLLLKQEA